MSSILRALKKLDEESRQREQEDGAEKIKMKRIVKQRAGVSRGIKRLFFIVPAVLLLAAAVWIVISSNNRPLHTKNQDKSPGEPVLTHSPGQVPPLKKELTKGLTKELIKASPGEAKPPAVSLEQARRPEDDKTLTGKTTDQKDLIKKTIKPNFILNGILWSAKAGRRVALINGRYLKEGEFIEGVLVVKIEKAGVILQSGQETWTLRVTKK